MRILARPCGTIASTCCTRPAPGGGVRRYTSAGRPARSAPRRMRRRRGRNLSLSSCRLRARSGPRRRVVWRPVLADQRGGSSEVPERLLPRDLTVLEQALLLMVRRPPPRLPPTGRGAQACSLGRRLLPRPRDLLGAARPGQGAFPLLAQVAALPRLRPGSAHYAGLILRPWTSS